MSCNSLPLFVQTGYSPCHSDYHLQSPVLFHHPTLFASNVQADNDRKSDDFSIFFPPFTINLTQFLRYLKISTSMSPSGQCTPPLQAFAMLPGLRCACPYKLSSKHVFPRFKLPAPTRPRSFLPPRARALEPQNVTSSTGIMLYFEQAIDPGPNQCRCSLLP